MLDSLSHPRRLSRAVEKAVIGDPVEALAEDRFIVDLEDELSADVIRRSVEFDGPNADVGTKLVSFGGASRCKGHSDGTHRLLAISARPPQ